MRSLGWVLIQYDPCPGMKRKSGHEHMKKEDDVKTQGEDNRRQAKKRKPTPPTPWSWTSSLQSSGKQIQLCKWPSLWYFDMAALVD